ncbi:choice-of-anchor P family protein [Microlunatus soli]|uniref:Uncharacterized protein n=1 Tax=Microlunatus soli TaxID=630515 RepID=A0A1H1RJV1_9ACTN|nr:choice-of-anchor P family protein [Microlunatus soli]SDS36067.1 hypothetical protein SAMN04489812_1677 [Microlunatus soli]
MFSLSRRRSLVAGAALALAGTIAVTPHASAAPAAHFTHGGSAYGSTAKLGSVVNSGTTSLVTMCVTDKSTRDNNAAAVNLGAAGKIGAVTTSIKGSEDSPQTVTTTKTGAVNLLGGIIRADAITTKATVTSTSSGFKTSGTTKIADLKIAGVPISVTPAKNTKISLPAGLGAVTLNRQASYINSAGRAQMIVDALVINVNKSSLLGLPSGAIVVGHSNALLNNPVHTRPYGNAYGSEVQLVGGVVKSGRTAATNLPCGGTTGRTLSNDTAAVSVPGILKVGAVGTTGLSTDSSTATAAKTSSTTGAVSVLDGAIKLDAITAKASATQKPGQPVVKSIAGTKLVGLTINGKPIKVTTKENTKIDVAGIGTLWLNKTTRSSTGISVYAVQLELLKAQSGMKAGAKISIGYARAGVTAK